MLLLPNAAQIQGDGSFETIIQPAEAYGKNLTAPLKAKGVEVYFVVGLDEQCALSEVLEEQQIWAGHDDIPGSFTRF